MKIIFSRKGFDSAAGGYASPIFPDGTLWSIPIPDNNNKMCYKDLKFTYESESISNILNDFCHKRLVTAGKGAPCDYASEDTKCHYDPQLMRDGNSKRIVLGQADAADGHLREHKVGKDDIFLFYGWYKEIKKTNNKWKYVRKTPDLHLIWGYMKVDKVIRLGTEEENKNILKTYPFLKDHPHLETSFCEESIKGNNSLYISAPEKYRYFKYDENKCLTNINSESIRRSEWRLPSFFNQPDAFTFLKEKNFKLDGSDVIITYSGYGQEFILDLDKVSDEIARNKIDEYIQKIIKD